MMDGYAVANTLFAGLALLLIAWHLIRVARRAYRHDRGATRTISVLAAITSAVLGVGLAIFAAIAGGRLVHQALAINGLAGFSIQIAAALLFAWSVGRLYDQWLAQPIHGWFAGEGARTVDR